MLYITKTLYQEILEELIPLLNTICRNLIEILTKKMLFFSNYLKMY